MCCRARRTTLQSAYQYVMNMYQVVLKLEESVSQLFEMFIDSTMLVDQQSELLDQIEFQCNSASFFIDLGYH